MWLGSRLSVTTAGESIGRMNPPHSATGGTAVAVTDAELLAGLRQAATAEGTWVCPETGACIAPERDVGGMALDRNGIRLR